MSVRRESSWAALVGLVSALVTLAVAEAAAIVVAAGSSPLFAVGSLVIDLVPGWVKEFVIALFGTNDKVALLVCLGLLVVVLALGIGILEFRRAPWGIVALALVGGIATVAATTRAGATAFWAVPTVLGLVAGVVALRIGTDRLRAWTAAARLGTPTARDAERKRLTRRRFLTVLGGTATGALVVGLGARLMNAATSAVTLAREAITLPKPTTAAAAVPAGAELGIPGLAPVITDNGAFYRIDTALQVPAIDAATWKLRVTGMVEREVELSFDQLLALPLTERAVTLTCVSNEVGGNLIGNAVWLGYPIRELLTKAGPLPGATMVLSRSIDGFTASTPLDVLLEADRDSLLAVGMNGQPLPIEHGFPVRMVVPGLYGYVSATKWVVELVVTTFEKDLAYWTTRGWSDHGPVKTASRIDVPTSGSRIRPGTVAVAGVAWAQHSGITAVEVRVDGGPWSAARLADAISADTWRQWVYPWAATSGSHVIEVRATDAAGRTQGGKRVGVLPNGAEGWHAVTVSVA